MVKIMKEQSTSEYSSYKGYGSFDIFPFNYIYE